MPITVTLAGLAEAPERVNDGPTTHDVRIFGSADTQLHDGCGSCDSIFVHGLERTKGWPDKENYNRRTEGVVVGDNRFGEVGVSLMYVSACIERAARLVQAS